MDLINIYTALGGIVFPNDHNSTESSYDDETVIGGLAEFKSFSTQCTSQTFAKSYSLWGVLG